MKDLKKTHNSKFIDYIGILRVFCVLTVVFFHCYGMMYADAHFPSSVEIYKGLYYHANQCFLINLAMPMFVFLSGYLFQYLLQLGKYPMWGNLFKKKALRILFPYFLFGLLFMGTTGNFNPIKLITGAYWHLWFLPMLFWCFLIGYAVFKSKMNKYMDIIIYGISYMLVIVPNPLPTYMMMSSVPSWFYWFWVGMLSWKYKDIVLNTMDKYKIYIPLILIYVLVTACFPIGYANQT